MHAWSFSHGRSREKQLGAEKKSKRMPWNVDWCLNGIILKKHAAADQTRGLSLILAVSTDWRQRCGITSDELRANLIVELKDTSSIYLQNICIIIYYCFTLSFLFLLVYIYI